MNPVEKAIRRADGLQQRRSATLREIAARQHVSDWRLVCGPAAWAVGVA
jgi:hypothetical protein